MIKKIMASGVALSGIISTNLLINLGNVNPVLSSSVLGLLFTVLFLYFVKKPTYQYSDFFYCGTFIGMIPQVIYNNLTFLLISTLISSFMLIITKDTITGLGGKLGTIAFISCLIISLSGYL